MGDISLQIGSIPLTEPQGVERMEDSLFDLFGIVWHLVRNPLSFSKFHEDTLDISPKLTRTP